MAGIPGAGRVPQLLHLQALGDKRMYGPDSVNFFTRRKTVTQRWPAGGVRETAQFTFPGNQ